MLMRVEGGSKMKRMVTFITLLVTIFTPYTSERALAVPVPSPNSPQQNMAAGHIPTRVLVIGGSITHGWFDSPRDRGFVRLAFGELTPPSFAIYNKAVPGAGVLTVQRSYPQWVREIQPQVVVIAWGTLNDIHHKLPMGTFRSQIRDEIQTALEAGANVIIVTPPVSRVSYRSYRVAEPRYLANEINIAKTYPRDRVEVINVFQEMKGYLKYHNIDINQVSTDGWHPNALGHQIAAQILLHGLQHGNIPL